MAVEGTERKRKLNRKIKFPNITEISRTNIHLVAFSVSFTHFSDKNRPEAYSAESKSDRNEILNDFFFASSREETVGFWNLIRIKLILSLPPPPGASEWHLLWRWTAENLRNKIKNESSGHKWCPPPALHLHNAYAPNVAGNDTRCSSMNRKCAPSLMHS